LRLTGLSHHRDAVGEWGLAVKETYPELEDIHLQERADPSLVPGAQYGKAYSLKKVWRYEGSKRPCGESCRLLNGQRGHFDLSGAIQDAVKDPTGMREVLLHCSGYKGSVKQRNSLRCSNRLSFNSAFFRFRNRIVKTKHSDKTLAVKNSPSNCLACMDWGILELAGLANGSAFLTARVGQFVGRYIPTFFLCLFLIIEPRRRHQFANALASPETRKTGKIKIEGAVMLFTTFERCNCGGKIVKIVEIS
jgi:hypothetical protein